MAVADSPRAMSSLTVQDADPTRRRSVSKDESPRSGLRPNDTLGIDRRESSCSLAERRLEEQRKYSSFGIEAPVLLDLSLEPGPSTSAAKKVDAFDSPNLSWCTTLKKKVSDLSTRSVSSFTSTTVVVSIHSEGDAPKTTTTTTVKKSISFSEATKDEHRSHKNAPECSTESGEEVVSSRRNSLFVKRGSLTMEPIKKVNLEEVYTVNKQLGTGRFGYVKLAEHKQSKKKIAIKFFPRPQTKQADFVREYNYSFFLSPHQHIIDTFEGMFQASNDSAFFFVQEFCPRASLREAVEATNQIGIGETNTKKVFTAVLSAIEFMHDENLVHRNLKAENILIFDAHDYSKVKVTDFGLTRKVDATVKYLEYVNNYHAPELCETVVNEVLTVNRSTDLWALGIIFFYCMKGRFPWQKASIMCKAYWEWEQWLKRKNPTLPKKFLPYSEKALKLFKKTLTPRVKDRWTAKDMRKCITKEKLLKNIKKHDERYYMDDMARSGWTPRGRANGMASSVQDASEHTDDLTDTKKRSTLQQWISTTLTAMAEISEQVVSARDD